MKVTFVPGSQIVLASALWLALLVWPVQPSHAAKLMLTDAEVTALQTAVADSNRGTRLEFSAEFRVAPMTAAQAATCRRTGKVPFKVVCALNETKRSGGRTLTQRLDGKVEIRVLDKSKKVVDSVSMALEKMCAS